jgi:hypothetical protein
MSAVTLSLSAVVITVRQQTPQLLYAPRDDRQIALPAAPLTLAHSTFERGIRAIVQAQTSVSVGYAEQLYTFGDLARTANSAERAVNTAYLALVREDIAAQHGQWLDLYSFLPWEDRRIGIAESRILPALSLWASGQRERLDRVAIAFGLHGSVWDSERVLERYELLWEAALLPESGTADELAQTGRAMADDSRRILATALGRLRGKLKYRPVIFELLPAYFTLRKLQHTTEALLGRALHTQNFRRLVEQGGLVEALGTQQLEARGRPAELFRFRPQVFRERPAPGVRLAV